jgi:hypothetical protein
MEFGYPLRWPVGWPRKNGTREAKFAGRTIQGAALELERQVELCRARDGLLSTMMELSISGRLRTQRNPMDVGAACYFTLKGEPKVLACDRWNRLEDNVWAIAKHVDALRGQDRWGVGTIEQAFTGYAALPPGNGRIEGGEIVAPWQEVLGFTPGAWASAEDVEATFRQLSKLRHPDVAGGSDDKMKELLRARDEALRFIGPSWATPTSARTAFATLTPIQESDAHDERP